MSPGRVSTWGEASEGTAGEGQQSCNRVTFETSGTFQRVQKCQSPDWGGGVGGVLIGGCWRSELIAVWCSKKNKKKEIRFRDFQLSPLPLYPFSGFHRAAESWGGGGKKNPHINPLSLATKFRTENYRTWDWKPSAQAYTRLGTEGRSRGHMQTAAQTETRTGNNMDAFYAIQTPDTALIRAKSKNEKSKYKN